MKLLLAGPREGFIDHNAPAFNKATQQLRGQGFEVINPAEMEDDAELVICLLPGVDALVVLPGWRKSTWASVAVLLAFLCRVPIREFPKLVEVSEDRLPTITHPDEMTGR